MWNEVFTFFIVKGDMLTQFLIESTIALTLLYVPYTLILRKERFFRQNRLTLLAILILSLALPFCDFHALYPDGLLERVSSAEPIPVVESQPIGFSSDASEHVAFTELANNAVSSLAAMAYLCILYIIGILVVLTVRLRQFIRMDRLIRRGCLWHDTVDGITIYCHATDIAPYSWMRHIVISQHDYDNHRHEILLHERGHVLCHHSWDILLLMLVQTVQWFNPFVYMLGANLRDIHEYEADDYVLRQGVTASEYQTLLLKTAVSNSVYAFANNFNHSLIKNRIVMMKNKQTNPWMRCKALYILPLAVVLLSAFATPTGSNHPDEETPTVGEGRKRVKVSGKVVDASNGKRLPGVNVLVRKPGNPRIVGAVVTENGTFSLETYEGNVLTFSFVGMQDLSVVVPEGGSKSMTLSMTKAVLGLPEMTVVGFAPEEDTEAEQETIPSTGNEGHFVVVELMPEFPGGMGECYKFLRRNVKYPTAASKAGIQGKVVVEFLVKEDGSIADISVKQGINPELDAEAMRVVSIMPQWKPGEQRGKPVSVRYEMPIVFSLKK